MITLPSKEVFFKNYNINPVKFSEVGLDWVLLQNIYADYISHRANYETPAKNIINKLMSIDDVHSVRYRIKNAEHLIEKIIRKSFKNPSNIIDLGNYQEKITDIIGIRALYLFKKDWKAVHEYIIKNYRQAEKPILYYRSGDNASYISEVVSAGCDAKEHVFGYRSLHYLVYLSNSTGCNVAEIQIRTIFEEAWSEIDHEIRYPYYLHHPVFLNQLLILNRLAGTADEMSSYMKELQVILAEKENDYKQTIEAKDSIINNISEKLSLLRNHAPEFESSAGVSEKTSELLSLSKDEIEILSDVLGKIKGIKRINIDSDHDGLPDIFLMNDKSNGGIIGVDKDQDGAIDYYIKL